MIRIMPFFSKSDKTRFFDKVSSNPNERGCLDWIAGKFSEDGYGAFQIDRKTIQAHRIAYFLATGIDPKELCVCHSCDRPPCMNPLHLFLGTHTDNMRDREAKNRGNHATGDNHPARLNPEYLAKGESHKNSKLTESQVLAIRIDKRYQHVIAKDFGIAQSLISKIKNRKMWVHLA